MFGEPYFGPRYFGPRYFGSLAHVPVYLLSPSIGLVTGYAMTGFLRRDHHSGVGNAIISPLPQDTGPDTGFLGRQRHPGGNTETARQRGGLSPSGFLSKHRSERSR